MTIEVIETSSAKEAFDLLFHIGMNEHNVVFRGHERESHRLTSTLLRHYGPPSGSFDDRIEEINDLFFGRLAGTGAILPWRSDPQWTPGQFRRARLEYARHHGAPSPLIDFSRSPFIAAMFAFMGAGPRPVPDAKAVVYALSLTQLASARAKQVGADEFDRFMYSEVHSNAPFEKSYEYDTLRFIHFPASWNRRMLRQQGCFIYDTVDYKKQFTGGTEFDLERLISEIKEPTSAVADPNVTLRKILIPMSEAKDVLRRLDLMGISASMIMDNHEGAARDVVNSYVFNTATGLTWDLRGDRSNY